jgi:hypothetical protein
MTHKEIKKDIHNKLEAALADFKSLLGEKKYNNRIKKAAKLIADGLGKEEPIAEVAKAETAAANQTIKTPAKKAVKAVAKKANKAVVKKVASTIAPKTTKAVATKKKISPKTK